MAYSHYLKAVLDDDPRFFYPMAPTDQNGRIDHQGAPAMSDGASILNLAHKPPMPGAPGLLRIPGNNYKVNSGGSNAAFYNFAFTLECWVHIDSLVDASNVIASCATTGNPSGFLLDYVLSGTIIRCFIGDTSGNSHLDAPVNYVTFGGVRDRALHLLGTTDGSRLDFYINGALRASDTTTAGTRFTTTPNLYIGRYNGTYTTYHQGGVGLVAGYHRYDTNMALRHYQAAMRPLGAVAA